MIKIKEIFNMLKEKSIFLYQKNKRLFFISIALILIVLLIFFIPRSQDKDFKEDNQDKIISSASYSDHIESKIKRILLSISEIDKLNVMVMVDSSPIKNYLKQSESTNSSNASGESKIEKEEVVYEKNGSSQTPVEVSTTYPKITGVLIVLNKIDASTKISIQNAVAGVLNIETSCIFILQDK